MTLLFAPDPGASRLAACIDLLLAAGDLRRGGNTAPAAIDVSPSARLAASMDRELARHGIRPGVSKTSKPVDISGMDLLSRSMRSALPQPQRAVYDRNWAQSELARPAPIVSKAFTPPPALVAFSPTPVAAAKAPLAPALTVSTPALSALLAHTGPATAAHIYPRSGDIAIFEAARGRPPRDIAELDKADADADAWWLAAGHDVDLRGLSEM